MIYCGVVDNFICMYSMYSIGIPQYKPLIPNVQNQAPGVDDVPWTEFWWLTVIHTVLLSRPEIQVFPISPWDGCGGFPPCAVLFLQQCIHMWPFCHWRLYLWELIIWYCSLLGCTFLPPGTVLLGNLWMTLPISLHLVLSETACIPTTFQWWDW